MHDLLKHCADVRTQLGGDGRRVVCRNAQNVLNLMPRHPDIGAGKIDFVDDGQDFQIIVNGQICVRQGLRLNPLRRVDDQQRALAGLQRAGYLVAEIDMPGCVDQIHYIGLPVVGLVEKTHRASLDRDAALTLQIHIVQKLFGHLAGRNRFGQLEQPVGQRGFAMVDMRDD